MHNASFLEFLQFLTTVYYFDKISDNYDFNGVITYTLEYNLIEIAQRKE